MAENYMGIGIATACVTASAAPGASVTLTIPAAGARKFHHITKFECTKFATAVAATGAVPMDIVTTNLPGVVQWWMADNALAAGGAERFVMDFNPPIKSVSADTATTFLAGVVQPQIQYLMSAWYY